MNAKLRRLLGGLDKPEGAASDPRPTFYDWLTYDGDGGGREAEDLAEMVARMDPPNRAQVEDYLRVCRKGEAEGPPPWRCAVPGCGWALLSPEHCHLCRRRTPYHDADGVYHANDAGPANADAAGGVSEGK